jgi:hypothetical protein
MCACVSSCAHSYRQLQQHHTPQRQLHELSCGSALRIFHLACLHACWAACWVSSTSIILMHVHGATQASCWASPVPAMCQCGTHADSVIANMNLRHEPDMAENLAFVRDEAPAPFLRMSFYHGSAPEGFIISTDQRQPLRIEDCQFKDNTAAVLGAIRFRCVVPRSLTLVELSLERLGHLPKQPASSPRGPVTVASSNVS